jgi:hypothetical protein
VWKIFVELSYFYKQICAKEISKKLVLRFEKEIVVLVCKMEKVFQWIRLVGDYCRCLGWIRLVGDPDHEGRGVPVVLLTCLRYLFFS